MPSWKPFALATALLAAAAFPACATKENQEAAKTDAKPAESVAAYFGNESISMAEVDEVIAPQLAQMRGQEYELRKQAAASKVAERILTKEAEARGMTIEQLLDAESPVDPPSDEEIQQIYERFKDQPALRGKSLAEARDVVVGEITRQKKMEKQQAYVRAKVDAAAVRYMIDPPRWEVAIPAGEPVRGAADAPVTIVEFSDFQCPYCKRAHPAVEQLLTQYGQKVRFVYRDFPLPNHPQARPASVAARCAGEQGKYWEYYKDLMETDGALDAADLKARAEKLTLDLAKFEQCAASDKYNAAIDEAEKQGRKLGVSGTPTFFVNGRRLVGVPTFEQLKEVVDDEIARTQPATGTARVGG